MTQLSCSHRQFQNVVENILNATSLLPFCDLVSQRRVRYLVSLEGEAAAASLGKKEGLSRYTARQQQDFRKKKDMTSSIFTHFVHCLTFYFQVLIKTTYFLNQWENSFEYPGLLNALNQSVTSHAERAVVEG